MIVMIVTMMVIEELVISQVGVMLVMQDRWLQAVQMLFERRSKVKAVLKFGIMTM